MVKRILRLALLTAAASAGCFQQIDCYVLMGQAGISVLDPVQIRVSAGSQWGKQLEHRFTADRGLCDNPDLDAIATYYAPFTGGADTIHIATIDRAQGTTICQQDVQVLVDGESLSSVDTKGRTLGALDNGSVRISPVRGFGRSVTLGEGRSPAISPEGRFMAYVKYLGDGTSQIIVRDPAGGERNLTNHPSLNVDPAWAPIKSDHALELVFSSDRTTTGQNPSQQGHSDHFNLWRVNVDAGDLRPVTAIPASARQASCSPDGRYIAFSSNLDNSLPQDYWNLYLTEIESGRLTKLTAEASPTLGAFEPTFSPNGSRLAYTRKYLLFLRDQQIPLQKILVADLPAEPLPSSAHTPQNSFGQFAMDHEDRSRVESAPSWSPDGNELAFVQTVGPESRVFRVRANPPSRGFGSDQLAEAGVFNAIEARWAWQPYIASSYGYGSGEPSRLQP